MGKALNNVAKLRGGDKGDISQDDVTGALDIDAGAVDNAELADMVAGTVKGRAVGAGPGAPGDLNGAQLAAIVSAGVGAAPVPFANTDTFIATRAGTPGSGTLLNLASYLVTIAAVYTAAAVGAVARSILDKFRETVSAEDFGAVGDGVADDTAALAAALLNPQGRVVETKPGATYRLTSGGVQITQHRTGFWCKSGFSTFYCPAATFNNTVVNTISATSTAIRASGITEPIVRGVNVQFEATDNGRWLTGVTLRNCSKLNVDVEGSGLPNGLLLNIDAADGGNVWNLYAHDCTTDHTGYGVTPQLTALAIDSARTGGVGTKGLTVHKIKVKSLLFGTNARLAYAGDQTDGVNIIGNDTSGGVTPSRGVVVLSSEMDGVGEAFDVFGDGCMALGGSLRNITAIAFKLIHGGKNNVFSNFFVKAVGWSAIYCARGPSGGAQYNTFNNITVEDVDPGGVWSSGATLGLPPQITAAVTFNDGFGLLNAYTLNGALVGAAVVAVVVNGAIDAATPPTGVIRITRADGRITQHPYTSWAGSTFTITAHDFSGNNANNGATTTVQHISGNVVNGLTVRGDVANMQYVAYSKTNAGDINYVNNVESPSGNTAYALFAAASASGAGVMEVTARDGRVIRNTAPRRTLENWGRGANEKMWDVSATDVASQLEYRTRTDADGAGETWCLVQRTGTNVTLIRLDADVMQFAGVASANRMVQINDSGVITHRYHDNSLPVILRDQNTGVSAVDHGVSRVTEFGIVAGVVDDIAAREEIRTTDTWAAAGNRSAKYVLRVLQAGVMATVLEFSQLAYKFTSSAPRMLFDETDAGVNERIYDQVQVAGDMSWRTRTDADGAGKTWLSVSRTGTTVDTIILDGTTIQFGGITLATRYAQINGATGTLTIRNDDGSGSNAAIFQNYGINSSGDFMRHDWQFGTGGAFGNTAARSEVQATDTWAAGGNRSVKWLLSLIQADTLTQVADWTTTRLLAATGLLSSHATAGVGYTTGAGVGGTVPQATNKGTGVTLNKLSGQITMHNAALAAGAKIAFTLTNSTIATADGVMVWIDSGGTVNAYRANVVAVGAGSCAIMVENTTGGSLSESPVVGFMVLKAAVD